MHTTDPEAPADHPPLKHHPFSFSVVLPSYNESHRLPQTLREIRPYLDERFDRYEVIVVDDGSTDNMVELVVEAQSSWSQLKLIRQPRNLGKGAAVRRGCLAATGDLVLFMDADHATPITEADEFIAKLMGDNMSFGVVAGCRTYQEDESKWRRVAGFGLMMLAHVIVFEKAVIDSQCGFKVFTRQAAQTLFSHCRVDGGMFDVELFYLMHKFSVRCYYSPVHWANKPDSRINILKCIVFDPIDLMEIRARGIAGVYDRPMRDDEQPWNRPA